MSRREQGGRTGGEGALVLAGLAATGLAAVGLAVVGLGAWAAAGSPFVSASRVVVLTGDRFQMLNTATGKVVSSFAEKMDVRKTALSPDGKTLASGNLDGNVTLWSVATGKPLHVLSGQTDLTESLAFSPDGKTLAAGSGDTTVKLWNVATGRETLTFTGGLEGRSNPESSQGVHFVAFSPDGRVVASGTDTGWIVVWTAATGKVLLKIAQDDFDPVYSAVFSPDGRALITGQSDKNVKVWDLGTGKVIKTLAGHLENVYAVALSPDGKLIASGGQDKRIKLWNLASGTLVKTLYDDDGTDAVAFSPDSRTLFVMNGSGGAKLWNVASGKVLWKLDPPDRAGRLRSAHPAD